MYYVLVLIYMSASTLYEAHALYDGYSSCRAVAMTTFGRSTSAKVF